MTATYRSKICAHAHNAMAHLFAAGLLDAQSMTEFDRLCRSDGGGDRFAPIALPVAPLSPPRRPSVPTYAARRPVLPRAAERPAPVAMSAMAPQPAPAAPPAVPPLDAAALRALREREGLSEAVFARCLNVAPQAVIAWEMGERQPEPTTMRLLSFIASKGLTAVD